ncbi:DUF1294 domain-containing protein [Granulicatella elegans]|uniref:DUF1294 domain-containing protein n=1 Tax=Granulicatella elegans TaxID=137732 RepID=UPI0028D0DCFF|nr:DUF1294 domain-containing protein [Granulicatella elegans]
MELVVRLFQLNSIPLILFYYFGGVNLLLFILMGMDKRAARRKKWRIPERRLLTLGMIGGGFGGILGMIIFHHKTHRIYFTICYVVNIICWGIAFLYFTKQF